MTVQVLPDKIANQIAAGEVVERPASVVKELVENAIDAGATRIQVEIEEAGKNRICVSDDGSGMLLEDAERAFKRHATSKIGVIEDLHRIDTLGFRGEALPSIASVARVRMDTATADGPSGTRVTVEGGGPADSQSVAHPPGTTIEVLDLFYNTPARRKFLKGNSTEASHISQVVTQQALANPNIGFSLVHGKRRMIDTLPTDQILYRIAELFGPDLVKNLVAVEAEQGGYSLRGYISNPVFTRSNRNTQYSFVNHRFIRDKVILHATQLGYSHLLPRGQHPVLFLFLSMDPELVDVNVHPAKAEVRFAFQQEVHRFICQSIKNALVDNQKPVMEDSSNGDASSSGQVPFNPGASQEFSERRPLDHMYSTPSVEGRSGESIPPSFSRAGTDRPSSNEGIGWDRSFAPNALPPGYEPLTAFMGKPRHVSEMVYSEFEPIGQLDNSFIVLQGKPGILVVDQHIAHERVLYERFRRSFDKKQVDIQTLLFPEAMEFQPGEAELLNSHLEHLKALGMDLEPFGTHGFLLRAVPALLKKQNHEAILREIAGLLPENNSPETVQQKFQDIIIMMSCRNAITINHPMQIEQVKKLIHDLEQTELPFTCPHGRPIALLFEMDPILKGFHRK